MDKLALLTSIVALFAGCVGVVLTIWQSKRQREGRAIAAEEVFIRESVLDDSRSLFQESLRLFVPNGTPAESHLNRLANLLGSSPLLLASPVLTDVQLAAIEKSLTHGEVWIVTNNDDIEFPLPQSGGAFGDAVVDNLHDGMTYRYIVADTGAARTRASKILTDFPSLSIRFVDASYWRSQGLLVDEFVIYHHNSVVDGYYLLPGSPPLKWIKMDERSARSRYVEVQAQWNLADPVAPS